MCGVARARGGDTEARTDCRATDACQIGKERVLSAGLSVYIQSDGFATEHFPNLSFLYDRTLFHLVEYVTDAGIVRSRGRSYPLTRWRPPSKWSVRNTESKQRVSIALI